MFIYIGKWLSSLLFCITQPVLGSFFIGSLQKFHISFFVGEKWAAIFQWWLDLVHYHVFFSHLSLHLDKTLLVSFNDFLVYWWISQLNHLIFCRVHSLVSLFNKLDSFLVNHVFFLNLLVKGYELAVVLLGDQFATAIGTFLAIFKELGHICDSLLRIMIQFELLHFHSW